MPAPQFVRRSYSGGDAVAQLVQPIGATDTAFTITPTTGWVEEDGLPLGTQGPFSVAIDRFTPQLEKILCSAINLNTGVVTVYVAGDGWSGRGYDGTIAQAHVPSGSTAGVQTCWTSLEADEANQAVVDILGGGGGALVSLPLGTVVPWAGFGVPSVSFKIADGSTINRTAYAGCLTAITLPTTGTTTAGSAVITGIPSTVGLWTNMTVTGARLGGAGTIFTIATVDSATQVTLTNGVGVTAGTAGALRFYAHGAGDGSTTFNLPDMRGRTAVGVSPGVPTIFSSTQPFRPLGQTGGDLNGATNFTVTSLNGTPSGTNSIAVSPYVALNWIIRVS